MEPYLNKEQTEAQQKAQVLIEALPYIQKFNRKIIVVKYGGSAMSDEELQRSVIQDVTLLKLVGFKPIIVHGGGKAISSWVKKSGKEAKFINGLRVTDAETCEIAEMVLGSVSKKLVSALSVSAARTEIFFMSGKNMQTDRISALSAKSLTSIPKFSLTCLRKTICRSSRPWAWMMISTLTISTLMRRRVPLPVPCAPTNLSI